MGPFRMGLMKQNTNYDRIAFALAWIAEHRDEQPGLQELADAMNLSPHHLQRMFHEWAGITPKQFLKSITREAAVTRLRAGESVLEAALNSGLSGPGRLHDLTISMDALTPGEIRNLGFGVELEHGIGETPFGQALISWNRRGINFLGFCDEKSESVVFHEWKSNWQKAELIENRREAQIRLDGIFNLDRERPIGLWLRGSPFQLKVWEALVSIPSGAHASYGDIASYISKPAASRAVGSAIASNPIAWIIPCHRVIRKTGELGGYRWGGHIKSAMIAYESANSTRAEDVAVSA